MCSVYAYVLRLFNKFNIYLIYNKCIKYCDIQCSYITLVLALTVFFSNTGDKYHIKQIEGDMASGNTQTTKEIRC